MRHLLLASLLGLISASAHAHGGGLNAEGCHNERRTGGYHCHRAPSVPRDTPRKPSEPIPPAEDARRLGGGPSSYERPTCHVGPRGGTYTITRSGRKNYSGC